MNIFNPGKKNPASALSCGVFLVLLFNLTGYSVMANSALPLIPAPQSWQPSSGSFSKQNFEYLIHNDVGPAVEVGLRIARQLDVEVVSSARSGSLVLILENHESLLTAAEEIIEPGTVNEGYRLVIRPDGMELSAQSRSGLFRGAQTLAQLMAAAGDDLICGVIEDQPEFPWRGMLLDCCRHFMPLDLVKSTIDQLAYHKFNVLHWHLTEDQGWRLEVPGYPQLTEVSAWRQEWDGTRYGGYYTTEQVREVVAYAAERFITVVPEIELPGHSVAALAAYPELSCRQLPLEVETQWGVFKDVYCAGNEQTFKFLEDVLAHAMDIFPSRYIHIGGDESPKQRWKSCDKCQKRMADEGLKNEHELQSWFIRRIEKYLLSNGRRLVGWDEILEGGLAPEATVQSWRGVQGAVAAAQQGHDAIVSPTSHCYFDADVANLDLRQVYSFRPRPEQLSEAEQTHILGGEMNLWSEYIPPERLNIMLFPRMTAMAECLWTAPEPRDFSSFWDRMRPHMQLLNDDGLISGPVDRPVRSTVIFNAESRTASIELDLDSKLQEAMKDRSLVMRYRSVKRSEVPHFRPDLKVEDMGLPAVRTSDSPVPESLTLSWPQTDPFTEMMLVQLFIDDLTYGTPEVIERSEHLALGLEPTLLHKPSSRYPGGGDIGLCNGLRGGINFRDGLWSGFEGNNLNATLDLGQENLIENLSIRFYQGASAWIFLPLDVEFQVSNDGQNWQSAGLVEHDFPQSIQDRTIRDFSLQDLGLKARYVRIIGRNPGICPEWHPGAGKPCWVFADEIVVQ